MTYSDINTLGNPLFNSSLNKPIISYSTYIRNKHKDLYCDYCRKHIYDGYIEFDPQYFLWSVQSLQKQQCSFIGNIIKNYRHNK